MVVQARVRHVCQYEVSLSADPACRAHERLTVGAGNTRIVLGLVHKRLRLHEDCGLRSRTTPVRSVITIGVTPRGICPYPSLSSPAGSGGNAAFRRRRSLPNTAEEDRHQQRRQHSAGSFTAREHGGIGSRVAANTRIKPREVERGTRPCNQANSICRTKQFRPAQRHILTVASFLQGRG